MTKYPQLQGNDYDILHNVLCLRLMKNDSEISLIQKHLCYSIMKYSPSCDKHWNFYERKKIEHLWNITPDIFAKLMYYIIVADYIIFRLGYRNKLRDDIESLKAVNKSYNGRFDWALDRYEGFKKSHMINYHIKRIETIGLENYIELWKN